MSIRTRDYLLTGAAALCGTVGALKAQAPATPADAVIRAETRLVLVDALHVVEEFEEQHPGQQRQPVEVAVQPLVLAHDLAR